jgi:uncharacterized membrane protein
MEPEITQEQKETGRTEAFSDGVFAVAVTLLILTIQVPPANQPDIPQYVLHQWPFFLAYVVSFLSILVMWANHHGIFNLVVRVDRGLTIINGLLLMFITFFDYSTAIVAAAIREGRYEQFAASFYTGTLFALTIVFQIFWRYIAAHPGLIDQHVDSKVVQGITREYRFGPLFYLVALIAALLVPLAGIAVTLLLAIYFGLTARVSPVHSTFRTRRASAVEQSEA